MGHYRVVVWTGPTPGDGSDASVWLRFHDSNGRATKWWFLDDIHFDDLEFNRVDAFYFKDSFVTRADINASIIPERVEIWFRKHGSSPGWRCDTIRIAFSDVTDGGKFKEVSTFRLDRWFDTNTQGNCSPSFPCQGAPPTNINPYRARHFHRNQFETGQGFPDNPDFEILVETNAVSETCGPLSFYRVTD